MPVHQREQDYFVPALTPYVQWVKAYKQLISEIYKEHKTVKRSWEAFAQAIPGVEQRLEFAVFEQILLFSLFLSEWNKTEIPEGGRTDAEISRSAGQAKPHPAGKSPEKLDNVIQALADVVEERDKTLLDLKRHELSALMLDMQNTQFERRLCDIEEDLDLLRSEIEQEEDQMGLVIQTLDICTQRYPLNISSAKTPPNKIGRWNAQRSKDGYFRLYRKIRGKVHSIYIGKVLDFQKAMAKIADAEKKLLIPDTAPEQVETAKPMEQQIVMKIPSRKVTLKTATNTELPGK